MASSSLMRPMPKSTESNVVPKSMRALYAAMTGLTDAFCAEHLNEDYRRLAQRMTAALCRKRQSPLTSGQPRTWACGIVYVLGQINFLTDPSTQPFMTTANLCSLFGVGQSTASAKAGVTGPLVARFSQIDGYRCLSLMRASGVVKCQLALA
jgi:hypothetical protein